MTLPVFRRERTLRGQPHKQPLPIALPLRVARKRRSQPSASATYRMHPQTPRVHSAQTLPARPMPMTVHLFERESRRKPRSALFGRENADFSPKLGVRTLNASASSLSDAAFRSFYCTNEHFHRLLERFASNFGEKTAENENNPARRENRAEANPKGAPSEEQNAARGETRKSASPLAESSLREPVGSSLVARPSDGRRSRGPSWERCPPQRAWRPRPRSASGSRSTP